jgi:3'-5' exonuclease
MSLIFDIETIGFEYNELDEVTQNNLIRWIRREAADDENRYNVLFQDLKDGLGFSPLTGEIVAIGVYDTEKDKGVIYYQTPESIENERQEENFIFKPRTEREMLLLFWEGIKNYKETVSFNGRSFDVPFLMIRSAVYRIRPSVNLMTSRYGVSRFNSPRHIDLLDALTWYGAVRRKGNLHLYCRALGIKSPKSEGITGDDVGRLFKEKKYNEIARYNSGDLVATTELYKIWKNYLDIS